MFHEAVVGDSASLLESGHVFLNLYVHPSVMCDGKEGVLVDDLLGDLGKEDAHILEAREGRSVVEVLDVGGGEACVGCRDRAVEEALGSGETGALGGCVAWVVETISADGETDSVDFGLVGADGCDLSAVRDLSAGGDSTAWDKENGVSDFDTITNALCETPKVVGITPNPQVLVLAADELWVLLAFAGDFVHHDVGLPIRTGWFLPRFWSRDSVVGGGRGVRVVVRAPDGRTVVDGGCMDGG